jgi:PAS domain S-box-containing protein
VISYWNRGAETLYGWEKAEALGKVAHQLMETTFPAPLDELNAGLLRTGHWEGELIQKTRDGTQVIVSSRWSLLRDQQGRPATILETDTDITERKRAEVLLRESEGQWREVFEHNPTMYFMVDATGTVLSVNTFGAAQLGYTPAELIGQSVLKVFFNEDREFVQRNVAACLDRLGLSNSW